MGGRNFSENDFNPPKKTNKATRHEEEEEEEEENIVPQFSAIGFGAGFVGEPKHLFTTSNRITIGEEKQE